MSDLELAVTSLDVSLKTHREHLSTKGNGPCLLISLHRHVCS